MVVKQYFWQQGGHKSLRVVQIHMVVKQRLILPHGGKIIIWLSYMDKSNWRKND